MKKITLSPKWAMIVFISMIAISVMIAFLKIELLWLQLVVVAVIIIFYWDILKPQLVKLWKKFKKWFNHDFYLWFRFNSFGWLRWLLKAIYVLWDYSSNSQKIKFFIVITVIISVITILLLK